MAGAKGSADFRNMIHTGKNSLSPKSPFAAFSPSYADYGLNSAIGSKVTSMPKECNVCHQHTSSETLFLEEQPSWLDELLNEPETTIKKGHGRSSSDSFAYTDAANLSNIEYVPISQRCYKLSYEVTTSSWGSQNFDHYNDPQQGSLVAERSTSGRAKNKAWEASVASMNHMGNLVSLREKSMPKNAGPSAGLLDTDQVAEKQDHGESDVHDPKSSAEKKDGSTARSTTYDNDTGRAKQQFAQRSRVRKLQYIAFLERNVQALQVEGSEVAAELEFLNQQNLILSMENKAFKQRLESMAQEQLIKYLEHEVLEREAGRLRSLYQQQQQQPQQQQPQQPQQQQPQQPQRQRQSSVHRRANSRDLDSQFANLSLNEHRDIANRRASVHSSLIHDSSSGADTISGAPCT